MNRNLANLLPLKYLGFLANKLSSGPYVVKVQVAFCIKRLICRLTYVLGIFFRKILYAYITTQRYQMLRKFESTYITL